MYHGLGVSFGYEIEPGPSETDVNKPVTVQLVRRVSPGSENHVHFGQKFSADELADLLHEMQKVARLLETHFVKRPEGYRTRHVFF